ncbi:UDP-N-acetylmuramoylalanine--D-glutamate ligase [Gammaproteobacteria bacterium 45_16_T64]|nr:UDP-N-acetylmuramoylalanine--D-glutamate ligase [Gammaproteobacteria bacterium 45_16_T64]
MEKTAMSQVNQKVVVGLGKTGLSCARFLLQQGESVAVTDSRKEPPGLAELCTEHPGVKVCVGGFDTALLKSANELIVSPGISLQEPAIKSAVQSGVPAIGDIELFSRYISRENSHIIAITGSNGKSTVTTLVGEMLRDAGHSVTVAGNIGLPVMDVLLSGDQAEFYVLELSSFQLETTFNLAPVVATILNISPDHLDRYDDIDGYIEAKQRIYDGCEIAVVNNNDANTMPSVSGDARLVTFGGASDDATYRIQTVSGEQTIVRGDSALMPLHEMALADGHNVLNALAGLSIAHQVGVPDVSMVETLRTFSGLAHRCEFIRALHGVSWINDSKGTNVGATISAISGVSQAYPGGLILIAGGDGKGASFDDLAAVVKQHVNCVVLIGADAPLIELALGKSCNLYHAISMEDAVTQSYCLASGTGAVLLSPACASFDMFSGYEDRGRQFVESINLLTDKLSETGELLNV